MKKTVFSMIFFILLLSVSITANSVASASNVKDVEKEVVLIETESDEVEIYESTKNDSPMTKLPNDTVATMLEEGANYSLVRYDINGGTEEGFVKNEFIVNENHSKVEESKGQDSTKEENNVPEEVNTEKEVNEHDAEEVTKEESSSKTADHTDATDEQNTSEKNIETFNEKKLKTVHGIALENPTYVYQSKSTDSTELKSYPKGSKLKYKLLNNDWYEATVKVDGEWLQGYIHAKDVDHSEKIEVQNFKGFAHKNPTNVYNTASFENSDVLKSYSAGSELKYRSYNDSWYKATVYVNGQSKTGYIHKDDVGSRKPVWNGYTQSGNTTVYASASKNSEALKSYSQGHAIKYRPYSSNWYAITVDVNGEKQTGFIHKNDVGEMRPSLQGYSQGTTDVYAETSKQSNVLKSYPKGRQLKYKEHNGNWYKATVKSGGHWKTGYIHKSDVGTNAPSTRGYAQIEATAVYDSTSKTSNVLKSYDAGTELKYRPYNDSWHEATVYVNGKKRTGYIHRDHVDYKKPKLTGISDKNPTVIYSDTSRSSSHLKSYNKGQMLKYKPYNDSWFEAKVKVNNSWKTGYIHKNDVVQPVGKTIVVDAGHGGNDGGTSGNGLVEKDLVLDLSKKTAKELEKSGFNVVMTRTTDEYVALQERTNIANNSNSHLFLSIHANSGGGQGVETWHYSKGPRATESKQFAQDIQSEVIKETNTTNRGIKDGNLHVNRESKLPSALVEVGFLDNKADADKLKLNSHKNSLVKGFVQGVKKYFKLPF